MSAAVHEVGAGSEVEAALGMKHRQRRTAGVSVAVAVLDARAQHTAARLQASDEAPEHVDAVVLVQVTQDDQPTGQRHRSQQRAVAPAVAAIVLSLSAEPLVAQEAQLLGRQVLRDEAVVGVVQRAGAGRLIL